MQLKTRNVALHRARDDLLAFSGTFSGHGVQYLVGGGWFQALVWLSAIAVCVAFTSVFISSAFEEYGQSGTITTVKRSDLPVTDIQVSGLN